MSLEAEISRVTIEHLQKPENARAINRHIFGYNRIWKHPSRGYWLLSVGFPHFGCKHLRCESWTDAVRLCRKLFPENGAPNE